MSGHFMTLMFFPANIFDNDKKIKVGCQNQFDSEFNPSSFDIFCQLYLEMNHNFSEH